MHLPVRLAAIDMDGTLLPSFGYELSRRNVKSLRAAQEAGIVVAIATGRRNAFAAPLLEGLGFRADMPLVTSNGAVIRTLGGEPIDRSTLDADVARGLCGLLRGFGVLVFTFDQPGRGELVLEDLERAEGRMQLWVEANRDAIEVIKPLEGAFDSRGAPIQGMVAGPLALMREAEKAFEASQWSIACECLRTEYPARDLAILDLLPLGISKGAALERLALRLGIGRLETLAIGDNWNDVDMLEWAGQGFVMGNAPRKLRAMARMHGWKQAPNNDRNGVAVVLEAAIARLPRMAAAKEPDLEEDRA
jgi:hydroxymethylpyrimidine pyrophosphatase-like HAD family hydrolase